MLFILICISILIISLNIKYFQYLFQKKINTQFHNQSKFDYILTFYYYLKNLITVHFKVPVQKFKYFNNFFKKK